MASNITPKVAPSLSIPKSSETCQVSVINAQCDFTAPTSFLVEPKMPGHDWINLPTFTFHIRHNKTGRELIFDLGSRKDWKNSVPHIVDLLSNHIPGFHVGRDVVDILREGNVDINNVEAMILSHWHFDHCGDTSILPKSVDLLVGPKFKETFLPGYPSKEDSPFHEAAFTGRNVVEIVFSDDFKIGQFQAHDYFGDGSVFILNVPGHAVGHISALVRTTPETFVFMGGDVCHFTGALRPTPYIPLPDTIPETTWLEAAIQRPCPCSAFTGSHPDPKNSQTSPFYKPSTAPESFYVDPPTAQKSITALAEFDADPNILIAIAHDIAGLDVYSFFPEHTMNDWKEKGWKQGLEWGFLNEIPYYGKVVRPPRVDGLYVDGKRVKGLDGKEV